MAVKSNNAEVTQRVHQVYTMVVSGIDTHQILQYASDNWNVSDRTTFSYIAKANKLLAKQSETIRDAELGKAMARLNNLYKSALKIQDFKTCLAVQKEINALLGLYAPAKIQVEDWRKEAQSAGIDPAQLFEELVQKASDALSAGNGSIDNRSNARGDAAKDD